MNYEYDDVRRELTGKTVTKVEVGEDGEFLRFTLNDGSQPTFFAYGDCCSHTWVQEVRGVTSLLNREVRRIEIKTTKNLPSRNDGKDMDDDDWEWGEDCVQEYGYTFYTDAGYFDIVYRNSSNGYYGGSLDLFNEDSLWLDTPDENTVWHEVTSDDWEFKG